MEVCKKVKLKYNNQILFGVYFEQDDYSKRCGFTDMIKLDEPIYVGNLTQTMGLKQQTLSTDNVEIIEWY